MPKAPLINLTFALSQLSGNQALMLKMFSRFAQEYQSGPVPIAELIEQGDLPGAKVKVHTLKGVTGNLGFSALQQACVALEQSLKQQEVVDTQLDEFAEAFNATLMEIANLESTDEAAPSASPLANDQQLKEALQNNAFISREQLSAWLDPITIDDSTKSQIREAIEDLEYTKALTLLENN